MTDKTLRTLASGETPQDDDLFLTRQGTDTVDKKVTLAQLAAVFRANLFNIITDTLDDIAAGTVNKHFTADEKVKLGTIGAYANVISVNGLSGEVVLPTFSVQNVTTSRALSESDNQSIITNIGAGSMVQLDAPTGLQSPAFALKIANLDSDGIRITMPAGSIIYFGEQVSTDGGSISTDSIGAVANVCQISATQWIVTSATGTWSVQ